MAVYSHLKNLIKHSNLKRAINEPSQILVELNRLYHTNMGILNQNHHATNILDEDWDNLIILDACRYDIFKEMVDISGKTGYKISVGSTTEEFIKATFKNRQEYDLVYVSSNGHYGKLHKKIDSEIFRYEMADRDLLDGLTTHPKTVTTKGINVYNQHPNKRFIFHYLQPHQPFVTEEGLELKYSGISDDSRTGLRAVVEDNNLTDENLLRFYKNNLELVLKEIKPLINHITGKTIITADHGEFIGETQSPLPIQYYGHPGGIYNEEVVKVPWHVIKDKRREIKASNQPYSNESINVDDIEEQLVNLGYKI